MGAELRIEGENVVRMATELAEPRGVSVPDAVAEAVRVRLEREREREREREMQERVARMLAMGERVSKWMAEPISSDHSWLYDEDGLPG